MWTSSCRWTSLCCQINLLCQSSISIDHAACPPRKRRAEPAPHSRLVRRHGVAARAPAIGRGWSQYNDIGRYYAVVGTTQFGTHPSLFGSENSPPAVPWCSALWSVSQSRWTWHRSISGSISMSTYRHVSHRRRVFRKEALGEKKSILMRRRVGVWASTARTVQVVRQAALKREAGGTWGGRTTRDEGEDEHSASAPGVRRERQARGGGGGKAKAACVEGGEAGTRRSVDMRRGEGGQFRPRQGTSRVERHQARGWRGTRDGRV